VTFLQPALSAQFLHNDEMQISKINPDWPYLYK